MAGPWEKYQKAAEPDGPWKKYRKGSTETPAAPAQPGKDLLTTIGDASSAFQAGANQGMTLGFNDELYAGATAPFRALGPMFAGQGYDLGKAYKEGLDLTREGIAKDEAKNPAAAALGDVTGSVVTGGQLAKGGVTLMNAAKPTITSLATRGAIEGGIYGGVSGFGRSDADSLEQRLWDAAGGAAWGAGTGGVMGGVAGALAQRSARAAIPTTDQLKTDAGALYDAAANKGVVFPQSTVKQVADDIASKAMSEGIDPTLHPRATAALKRLQDAASNPMTVQDAQTMRRIISAAGKDFTNPDEGRIAGQMLDQFDNMLESGAPELAQARTLYHSAKKAQVIEDLIQKAKDTAGPNYNAAGMDTALRQQFKNLLINKKALRGFSAEEIDAIREVVNGGPLRNILRWMGKFAPTGVVSFGVSTGVPFALANAVAPGSGPIAAAAVPAVGFAARQAGSALTKSAAVRAALLARSGGRALPVGQIANPAIVQALIASGGIEAPKIPMAMRASAW